MNVASRTLISCALVGVLATAIWWGLLGVPPSSPSTDIAGAPADRQENLTLESPEFSASSSIASYTDSELRITFSYPANWVAGGFNDDPVIVVNPRYFQEPFPLFRVIPGNTEAALYWLNGLDRHTGYRPTGDTMQIGDYEGPIYSNGYSVYVLLAFPTDTVLVQLPQGLNRGAAEYLAILATFSRSSMPSEGEREFRIRPPAALVGEGILVATKHDREIVVTKMPFDGSDAQTVLTYLEPYATSTGGNLWMGLPPSVALSRDGTRLAYSSIDGLHVHSLSTGKTETLVRRTPVEPVPELDTAPTWSSESLSGAYFLATPRWSKDDAYLALNVAQYEGSQLALVRVRDGSVIVPKADNGFFGVSPTFDWSPTALQYAVPNTYGYMTPGLFVADEATFARPLDVAPSLSSGANYVGADFSADGTWLTTSYYEGEENTERTLAVLNLVTRSSMTVAVDTDVASPFFGSDPDRLYFLRGNDQKTLRVYDLSTSTTSDLIALSDEYNHWQEVEAVDDYLALVGSAFEGPWVSASDSNRLFLYDRESGRLMYASEPLLGFTAVLGLVHQ